MLSSQILDGIRKNAIIITYLYLMLIALHCGNFSILTQVCMYLFCNEEMIFKAENVERKYYWNGSKMKMIYSYLLYNKCITYQFSSHIKRSKIEIIFTSFLTSRLCKMATHIMIITIFHTEILMRKQSWNEQFDVRELFGFL